MYETEIVGKKRTLSTKIFNNLHSLKNDLGEPLIAYEDYSDKEHNGIKAAFKSIILGDATQIKIDLKFNNEWPAFAIYYFFGKLLQYNEYMSFT